MRHRRCDRFHHARTPARRLLARAACLGALLAALPAGAQEPAPAGQSPAAAAVQAPEPPRREPPSTQREPAGLAELSLEQLLEVEIVPINVLGSHTHLAGERMLGYRFMSMDMKGNRTGTHRRSVADVLQQYPIAHTKMTMDMSMVELMYASSDNLTLMLMLPYRYMAMDHVTRTGGTFTTVSEGPGDLTLMALRTIKGNVHGQGTRVLLNAGLSFPTGSIDKRDDTLTTRNAKLEYMMQLGSGTYDLLPGVTYLRETTSLAWGAQAMGTVRLGRNHDGYRLGNELRLAGWGYYKVTDWFGPSLRMDWYQVGNVRGRDRELNRALNSANDPNLYKAKRLDLFVGLNFYVPRGRFRGHRLTIEGGWPLYQDLDGPQLETDFQWTIGWSYVIRD